MVVITSDAMDVAGSFFPSCFKNMIVGGFGIVLIALSFYDLECIHGTDIQTCSHPITVNSKLYFNYGHFVQEPASSYRFRLQRESNGLVTYMGNPNMILEQTIQYELGYEHNLFDMLFSNFRLGTLITN